MQVQSPIYILSSNVSETLPQRDKLRRRSNRRLAKSALAVNRRNDLLPTLQSVDRDPRILRGPTSNVRQVDAGHVRAVANSIMTLGFSVPVLIDEDGVIIDGIIRTEAAKLLNLPSIPCVLARHLNEKERDLLRIGSNRLAEKGAWAFDELQVVIEQLVIDDAPIEILGFDPAEIDGILAGVETEPVEEGTLAPTMKEPATSRVGDVYQLGEHKLICGDATDPRCVHQLMGGDFARIVFTDEPYNVPIVGNVTHGAHREFAMASGEMSDEQFRAFNESWMANASRYLTDGGVLATYIDWRGLPIVTAAAISTGLSQVNLVVWGKTNAGMGSLYRSQHELLPIFKKGAAALTNNVKLGKTGRSRSNLWTYAGASSRGSDARQGLQYHPTVKPVAMLTDALLDMTDRGDIVLDPFLGSGSTLIAAERTGRICRGVELDPLYVDLIVRRFEEVTGQPAIFEETGETFAILAQRRKQEQVPFDECADVIRSEIGASEAGRPAPATLVCRTRTRVRTHA